MPKTSHQHFSVALLSKVNDKNWPETKIWKTSYNVTFFKYLQKKPNFDNHLWSWCTYPNPNRSKTPLTLFSGLKNPPPTTQIFESFHFCLDKISFFNALNVYFLSKKSKKMCDKQGMYEAASSWWYTAVGRHHGLPQRRLRAPVVHFDKYPTLPFYPKNTV